MDMLQGTVSDQFANPMQESNEGASQAFREELSDFHTSAPQEPKDAPETPQDRRARELVTSLCAPNLDWGKMTDKLRYTFVDEMNENGLPGMHELAGKVSLGIGRPVSVDRFRDGGRVFAIYIHDPNGRMSEIPITGRGSPQLPSNPFPYYPSPYDPSVPPTSPYDPSVPPTSPYEPTVPTLPTTPNDSTQNPWLPSPLNNEGKPWRASPFDPPTAPPLFPKQTIPNPLEKDPSSQSFPPFIGSGGDSVSDPWLPFLGTDSTATQLAPSTAPTIFSELDEGRRSDRRGSPHYEDPHHSSDSPYYEDPDPGDSPYYEDPGSGGSPYYEDPGSGGSPYYEDPGSNDTPYSP